MKIIFIFIAGLGYGIAFGQKSIPKYEIHDQRLLNVLTKFADTINSIHNGKWIMEVHFSKAFTRAVHPQTTPAAGAIEIDLTNPSLEVDLVFTVFATSNIWRTPIAYTEIKEIPFLIFTGIEELMIENRSTIQKLRKKFKKRIVSRYSIGISHAWYVNLKDDSLKIQTEHAKPDY
jgi:hypothetical protein